MKWSAFVVNTAKEILTLKVELHLTGVAPMIRHLKLVTDVVFCKDSGKEIKIVGFGQTEGVRELLCFGVPFDSFLLLVSLARDIKNKTSDNWNRKARLFRLWTVACT